MRYSLFNNATGTHSCKTLTVNYAHMYTQFSVITSYLLIIKVNDNNENNNTIGQHTWIPTYFITCHCYLHYVPGLCSCDKYFVILNRIIETKAFRFDYYLFTHNTHTRARPHASVHTYIQPTYIGFYRFTHFHHLLSILILTIFSSSFKLYSSVTILFLTLRFSKTT